MYKPVQEIIDLAFSFWKVGHVPEAADVLRYGLFYRFNNDPFTKCLEQIENDYLGGKLLDNNWNIENDSSYNKDIKIYKNYDCIEMPT